MPRRRTVPAPRAPLTEEQKAARAARRAELAEKRRKEADEPYVATSGMTRLNNRSIKVTLDVTYNPDEVCFIGSSNKRIADHILDQVRDQFGYYVDATVKVELIAK